MATKEEWVRAFETATGRKPTAAEYSHAMENGFDLSAFANVQNSASVPQQAPVQAVTPELNNNRDNWMKLFESLAGRKPTGDEFMKGKAANFDTEQIASILNPESSASQQPSQIQTNSIASQSGPSASAPFQPASSGQETIQHQQPQANSSQNLASPALTGANTQQAQTSQPANADQADFQNTGNFQQAGSKKDRPSQILTSSPAKSGKVLNLILPIISMVLSVVFVTLAFFLWAPLFLGLSFLGLICAGILLILNVNGKKVLSMVATAVALLAVIFSNVALFTAWSEKSASNQTAANNKKKSKVRDDSTDVKDYIKKGYKFEWSQSEFKKLKAKSDMVSDVIEKHGKASDAQISGDRLTLVYQDSKTGSNNSVTLSFEKQYNGKFVLSGGHANFNANDIDTSSDYKSDWKRSDYDALKAGNSDTGDGGTKWSDIKSKHSTPSSAYYTLSFYGDEDISYELAVTYADYDTDASHITYVGLHFKSSDEGKTYRLASKYSN